MKEHKIFKPEIMLTDYVKSSWSKNIKTLENKIPVSQFLKHKGIWALEISPQVSLDWYAFGLPVNKNWEPESFEGDAILSFQIYAEGEFELNIFFEDTASVKTDPVTVIVKNPNNTDTWDVKEVPISIRAIRMVLFTGAANTPNYVIKDIVIKS